MAVSKLVLIGSGVGASAATAGGVALYLTSGETLKEHVSKVIPSNKQFITLVADANTHLEKKYKLATQDKKPVKDGKAVEKIVEWCKESENIKFSSESDRTYVLFSEWCFVNTNTLLKEAKFKGKFYVSDKGKDDEEWKTAWDTYSTGKGTGDLQVNEKDAKDINSDRSKGGPALHDWCKGQDNKKMYEENSEDTYKRYEKWCFQPS